jgi:hypothetical protein
VEGWCYAEPFGFGGDFHSLLGGFLFVFRSRFMGCLCENPQKTPG